MNNIGEVLGQLSEAFAGYPDPDLDESIENVIGILTRPPLCNYSTPFIEKGSCGIDLDWFSEDDRTNLTVNVDGNNVIYSIYQIGSKGIRACGNINLCEENGLSSLVQYLEEIEGKHGQ